MSACKRATTYTDRVVIDGFQVIGNERHTEIKRVRAI